MVAPNTTIQVLRITTTWILIHWQCSRLLHNKHKGHINRWSINMYISISMCIIIIIITSLDRRISPTGISENIIVCTLRIKDRVLLRVQVVFILLTPIHSLLTFLHHRSMYHLLINMRQSQRRKKHLLQNQSHGWMNYKLQFRESLWNPWTVFKLLQSFKSERSKFWRDTYPVYTFWFNVSKICARV